MFDTDRGRIASREDELYKDFKVQDFRALKILIQLLDENESSEDLIDLSDEIEPEIELIPEPCKFRTKSQRFPNLQTSPAVWAFLKQTRKQIENLVIPKISDNNLSKKQQQALTELTSNSELVIKPSDKGGNVVVMTRIQYIKMCDKILCNDNWYKIIAEDDVPKARSDYISLISLAFQQGLIDQDLREYLEIKWPITPTFYSLPKIHKDIRDPPGRPIISGIGSHTETASKYVDMQLRPHVMALPSYLKDTLELLKIVEGMSVPPGSILAAIDVEALYSSIPHTKGIQVISQFLREQDHNNWKLCNFVTALLEHILTNNVFVFNGSTYLQVQGVAMGTSCAPSYATLYLGGWERAIFSDDSAAIYLRHILLWRRYIDDVLVVWTGGADLLAKFMEYLSINNYNLKFTIQSDTKSIPFLDLKISVNDDGTLSTNLYRKETAGNTILHYSSSHPRSLVRSIPYSQYLRLRRNCAKEEDFEKEASALYSRLLLRGYSKKVLKQAYAKSKINTRDTLLFKKKEKESNPTTKLITTFSSDQNIFRQLINHNWHFLAEDPIISKYISQRPEIVYRRCRSIKDGLTHSHLVPDAPTLQEPEIPGTYKCGHCDVCPWIEEGDGCPLPRGGFLKSKKHANCSTIGIVYLAKCRCGAFYIGKTKRAFSRRIKDHLYYLEAGLLYTPICKHVGLHHSYDPSFITFFALEVISPPERGGDFDKKILQREARWIFDQRATYIPGLNTSLSFKPFL
ncbi:uncharacterized protein LOC120929221 [Rana temporaria]|uniref:uncharacterized protein LOC120929221 n=1 Tax=Rana temporaria TaxID=8407 RepID=UPI001AAC4F6A|nr:uncharacterized protein LOC120929221 [Rana temporaria]